MSWCHDVSLLTIVPTELALSVVDVFDVLLLRLCLSVFYHLLQWEHIPCPNRFTGISGCGQHSYKTC